MAGQTKPLTPDKRHAAVCGLFCPSCSIFIGSADDPERLVKMAERRGTTVEALRCEGCRAEVRPSNCKTCSMAACAAAKGIDFCGECGEYPCEELRQFQAVKAHRLELWRAQDRIREAGFECWYGEMVARYSCPECGTMNSAYDPACRKCGHDPSCGYVAENKEEIARRIAKMERK